MPNAPLSYLPPTNNGSSRQAGFSLIELMVVVAIIAILAAIAIPGYQDYIVRSRLTEATSLLAAKRVQVEQFYDNNRTYVNAPGCADDATSSKSFTFSCANVAANTYRLEATGKSTMSGFTLRIDQDNNRSTPSAGSGWSANNNCWVTKKDGSC